MTHIQTFQPCSCIKSRFIPLENKAASRNKVTTQSLVYISQFILCCRRDKHCNHSNAPTISKQAESKAAVKNYSSWDTAIVDLVRSSVKNCVGPIIKASPHQYGNLLGIKKLKLLHFNLALTTFSGLLHTQILGVRSCEEGSPNARAIIGMLNGNDLSCLIS